MVNRFARLRSGICSGVRSRSARSSRSVRFGMIAARMMRACSTEDVTHSLLRLPPCDPVAFAPADGEAVGTEQLAVLMLAVVAARRREFMRPGEPTLPLRHPFEVLGYLSRF